MNPEMLKSIAISITIFTFLNAVAWGVFIRKNVAGMMNSMEKSVKEYIDKENKHQGELSDIKYFDRGNGIILKSEYKAVNKTLNEIKIGIDNIWKAINKKQEK